MVHVLGEIDLATAPQYRSELIAAASASTALAIDLTDCDLIDSVGLGVTVGGARRMWGAGGQFAHRAAQVQHARAPALRHGRGAQPGGGDGRGGVVGAAGGHGGHRPRQLRHPRRRPGVAPAPDGPA